MKGNPDRQPRDGDGGATAAFIALILVGLLVVAGFIWLLNKSGFDPG